MLAKLFTIVAPVYVCAALGYGWVRTGRRFDTRLITDLVALIGAPCLIFSSLVKLEVERGALAEMALAAGVATIGFVIVGACVLRALKLPRTTFLAPISFGNTGNMGLPICLFAFGEEGLALAICFFATVILIYFTVGQWLWSGRASVRQLFLTPLTWSVVLATFVLATEAEVPEWIVNSTELLGDFTIPLMVFTLGVSLAELRFVHAWRSFWLSLVRLVIGLGVGLLVASLLGLEGIARNVFLIQCAMPAAVINYLLAQKYDRDPLEVAGLVVVSTLVSFASIPAILAWLMR